tara:strand:- start:325 stop:489 length:165 start_codon:yes stop_codon:yes gene_type:complete
MPPKKKPKKPQASRPQGTKRKTKVPKGSHRMPDGSIMKDKDMKKTSKKGKSYKK